MNDIIDFTKRLIPPSCKAAIKQAIHTTVRFSRNEPTYKIEDDITCITLTEKGNHIFFGYYDISPFHESTTRILACKVSSKKRHSNSLHMDLGWYDTSSPDVFHKTAETQTWCWQQGARLQWVPKAGTNAVLYNTLCNGHTASVVKDVKNGNILYEFPMPTYALDASGKRALSLDFARLQRLRPGYGYGNIPELSPTVTIPADNGLFLVTPDNEPRLILSLENACHHQPSPTMASACHYFNHPCWTPSGSRLMVFHIWVTPDGTRRTRLLTLDATGDNVRVLTHEDHVSHYWWVDDSTLLLYATHGGRQGYFMVRDEAGALPEPYLPHTLPSSDGHPSFCRADTLLVGDTLPGARPERNLWVANPSAGTLTQLGSFYSPPNLSGEHRCDLHPRWNADGTRIAIDTAHTGKRSMIILDISKFIQKHNASFSS